MTLVWQDIEIFLTSRSLQNDKRWLVFFRVLYILIPDTKIHFQKRLVHMKLHCFFVCFLTFIIRQDTQAMGIVLKTVPKAKNTKQVVVRKYASLRTMPLSCNKCAYNTGAQELRDCIKNPEYFSSVDVDFVIQETLPHYKEVKPNPCRVNGLIDYVVERAMAYPKHEDQYAQVIELLSKHGWNLTPDCCNLVLLHTVAKHDLPNVASALKTSTKNRELLNGCARL